MVDLDEARGFLTRLLKYAPRKGRTPREDFFTEALAGYFRVVPSALNRVLAAGVQAEKLTTELWFEPAHLRFDTQTSWGEHGRPDLIVSSGGEPVLIIECKQGAAFTESKLSGSEGDENGGETHHVVKQIPKYCEYVRSMRVRAKVLVLSLAPRHREVLSDLKDELREIYVGNLLWSDVYGVLRASEVAPTAVGAVLTELIINLMEDLEMPQPAPLNCHSVEPYHAYRKTLATMGRLLDEVLAAVALDYQFEPVSGKNGSWYVHKDLQFGDDLCLGFYLEFENVGKKVPLWPMMYVEPGYARTDDALELLPHEDHEQGWPGKVVYPEQGAVMDMLEASTWQEQVAGAAAIYAGWLEPLAKGGLVRRRNPRS